MRPIRGARVNRLRSNATKRPIRGGELIKVRDLFKEIRYTGKLVSVIKSKLSWLDMSVCKLDCNEDIFVTLCSNI